jgi:hypothetical protein
MKPKLGQLIKVTIRETTVRIDSMENPIGEPEVIEDISLAMITSLNATIDEHGEHPIAEVLYHDGATGLIRPENLRVERIRTDAITNPYFFDGPADHPDDLVTVRVITEEIIELL